MLRTALTLALTTTVAVYGATFDVTFGTAGHNVPSTLYGLMFEDINHGGDGGLYAELIQNRAFQQVTPGTSAALNSWAALGRATISVVNSSSPVSTALPNALSFSVASGTTGTVGFTNAGFFGFPVTAGFKYTGSFFYRTPSPPAREVSGTFTADLRSTSGTVFTSTTVPFTTSSTWQQATFSFTASSTQTSVENLFALSVNAATVAGLTMEFTLISLFPPTFNNRANGFRLDLSETILAMKPAFFRFPGGNNLEGETPAERWAWENTVGDLVDRPGRLGTWGYVNTDGLGLFEYLQWIEDMDMQPIMAVYDFLWTESQLLKTTFSLTLPKPLIRSTSSSATPLPILKVKCALPWVIQTLLPLITLRSEMRTSFPQQRIPTIAGQTSSMLYMLNSPSSVPILSDISSNSTNSSVLDYIATSATSGFVPTLTPAPTFWDLHIYSNPNFFINGAFNFDILPRNGLQFFQGEYACMTNNDGTDLSFPFIDGSIAEAAYMTGFDRNSDIVFAASYAPLLQHISNFQWSPDLISFSPNTVIPSTSYYVQKLFSLFKGDFYLASTTNTASSPVQWSVTRDTASNQYFLKVVNAATTANTVVFTLPFTPGSTAGTGTILTAPSGTMNTPTNPNAAVPSNFSFTAGKTITYNAPALSLSILTVVG